MLNRAGCCAKVHVYSDPQKILGQNIPMLPHKKLVIIIKLHQTLGSNTDAVRFTAVGNIPFKYKK